MCVCVCVCIHTHIYINIEGLVWFGFFFFNDISVFEGYLMPNPFLLKNSILSQGHLSRSERNRVSSNPLSTGSQSISLATMEQGLLPSSEACFRLKLPAVNQNSATNG